MPDIAQSVIDRLRNKARNQSKSFQLLLQLFCQEEFLRSRMKDYYDIYYLANTYIFDGRKLQEAIFETLQNRGTSFDSNTLEVVRDYKNDKNMQLKWKYFTQSSLGIELDFEKVLTIIYTFLNPVFIAIINESEIFGSWNPELLKYEL